jgi:uncharacterized protein (DUF488 family)
MLTTGEKSIIFLLNYNEFKISKMRLIKLMFLISKRASIYDFVPYKYGPFSFRLYYDLSKLVNKGYVSIDGDTITLIKQDLPKIDYKKKNIIRIYSQQFSNHDDKTLLNYIYDNYPQYTILSLYMKNENYNKDSSGITTIGYEGKSLDRFLAELIRNKINMVIDVRRNPYSRKFGFQGYKLRDYLKKVDIEYLHIPELGIASELRRDLKRTEDYLSLFADYKIYLETKKDFLEEIKLISKNKRVSLMCYEKDIDHCHRGVLAEYLRVEGVEVTDI